MNILGNGDMGIESIDDGSWPTASYPSTPKAARVDTTETTGQKMHKVQMRINALGKDLTRLYGQPPVDTEEVGRIKEVRSAARAENRILECTLENERSTGTYQPRGQSWTLGG